MKVLIPDLVSNSYFPAIAAVELGFFKDEGLDASLDHIYPVTKCLEIMRDGEADFVAGSAHAVPQVFPGWKGGKLLAALAQRMYWILVLRSDLGAKKGDIEAVKGLRLGAAPLVDQGLRGMLTEAGIDIEKDGVEIGPVPGAAGSGVSFGVQAAKALEEGLLDGFWANAMGAECAVLSGAGTAVIDVRRGDGPDAAKHYTFPVFVTTESLIESDPDMVAAATRAIVKVQRALKEEPERAFEVGKKLFPDYEAGLIVQVLKRDLPYYDPAISQDSVTRINEFVQGLGALSGQVPYEQAVATQFSHLWTE